MDVLDVAVQPSTQHGRAALQLRSSSTSTICSSCSVCRSLVAGVSPYAAAVIEAAPAAWRRGSPDKLRPRQQLQRATDVLDVALSPLRMQGLWATSMRVEGALLSAELRPPASSTAHDLPGSMEGSFPHELKAFPRCRALPMCNASHVGHGVSTVADKTRECVLCSLAIHFHFCLSHAQSVPAHTPMAPSAPRSASTSAGVSAPPTLPFSTAAALAAAQLSTLCGRPASRATLTP